MIPWITWGATWVILNYLIMLTKLPWITWSWAVIIYFWSQWMSQDNLILYKDLWSLEILPHMGGCMGWLVVGGWLESCQIPKTGINLTNWDVLILFDLDLWFVEISPPIYLPTHLPTCPLTHPMETAIKITMFSMCMHEWTTHTHI